MTSRLISVPYFSGTTMCGVLVTDDTIYHQCVEYQDVALMFMTVVFAIGIVETTRKALNCCIRW